MEDFWANPIPRAIVLFAVIGVLVAVGAYVVSKLRDTSDDTQGAASELLTNFRDLHSKGDLTDEEFRTIKTTLADKLRAEIKDSEKPG